MIQRIVTVTGLNRAIGYSLLTKAWQVIAGPISILLMTLYFSIEEQGFYYTFASILALQGIFELGLSFVILQFASHEFASLSWGRKGQVIGEEVAVSRFYAVIERAIIWYGIVAIMLVLVLLPAGGYFFSSHAGVNVGIEWECPWGLLVLSAALYVPLIPVMAAIEGSGEVSKINKLRLMQVIFANLATWTAIASGGGLFSASLVYLINALIGYGWITRNYPEFFRVMYKRRLSRIGHNFHWMAEIWPMQWRIAVSWISGYVIFQLMTPIIFYFQGAGAAGKMGMSLVMASMTVTFAQVWLQTNTPRMAQLVARKNWDELDQIFARVFWQSTAVVFAGSILVLMAFFVMAQYPVGQRFLQISDMVYLLGAFSLTHVIGALAHYLRMHKQEPFMALSVIGAILTGSAMWFFGHWYGSTGMAVSLFVINLLFGLPSAVWLWLRLKKKWHTCC